MKLAPWLLGILILCIAPSVVSAEAAPAPAAADPHQQLDQILQRPMFRAWRDRQAGKPMQDVQPPQAIRDFLQRCANSIKDFLKWVFRTKTRTPSGSGGSSVTELLPAVLKAVAWTVLVVAAGFFAFLLFKRMGRSTEGVTTANVLSRQQVHAAMEAGDALALGTAEWMEEARRLAAEGNFRAVYRALYLALLSGLHTAGKIEHSRNRTNWTYVNRYRGPAEERSVFSDLTELFDRVWYGRKNAEGADLEALKRQVNALTGGRPA